LIEAWQRQRLFEALARAVLIRREPLLLFLDDVQWCDRETLDWLHFLLQFDPAAPLLIVGTLLSEEAADNEALTTWRLLLQKHDRLTEIPLARFDAQTTAALASNLSGTELQATEATQLYRETEGNPLFVVELVRAGQPVDRVAGTTDQSGGTPLPPKVQATIQYRLSQLSANAQSLIQIAAVIGREFTVEVLARACDQTEDMLVAGLDELWRKHIVREQGASAYDFSHDKIRLVAYAALNATRRRMLHRKVAEALVNVYAIGLDAISGQIAQHYEIAGQTDRAVEFYRRAVDAARSIYSHHEALAALEKSINLLDSLVDEGVRRELAPHLQERLGDVREHLTQHGAARDAYAAALAGAPASDKIRQARLCRKIGKTLEGEQADYALVVEKYDRAEALLDTPHETAGADWWEEWCQVQLEHLILLYWWGRDEVMADWIAVARPLIEQHGTPAQLAALFSNLSRQLNRRNRFAPSDRALNYARAALGALFPSTSPELRAPYQFSLGFNLLWHGDLAEAQAELQAALTHAVQTGDVILQARCLAYLAVTCRRQNCAVETEAYARRGLAVAETARMLEYIGSNRANLAWVAWQRGDLMVAEQLAQAALEAWQLHTLSYPLYWFALLPLLSIALRRRALDRAIEWARRLIDPLQFKLPDPIEPLLQQGLAAAQAEDMATTQRLLTDAIDHAQSLGYL
jgi:tetratricopeptide (TPR) repeat protein